MFAQINHMAIISPNYPMLGKFYEAVFGLKLADTGRTSLAVSVGDGYVGMTIIPQFDGYIGGLDHFGIVVDDVDVVLVRMRRKHSEANIVKRTSGRPFAAYSGHDPDGNVFDLAQKKEDTRSDIYAEQASQAWHQDRYVNKFALRTQNAERCAEFYADVFELKPVNRKNAAPGYHLTDGRVTLSILPWSIPIFEGMSIKRPGPDHIGLKVESIDALKKSIVAVVGGCTYLAPIPIGGNKEAEARKALLAASTTGKFQLADPDGNWIDVTDE